MAHDMPMAGHMGVERTLQRIRKSLWWPGVTKDVKTYVQSCPECQKVARRPMKVPLVKMPIIGKPFERIAMDIVGPLPKTTSGHQYILVISDYATRFPEAYPLRRFTAVSVADKLMDLFSRVGVPNEILTDQGTNFTSELLKELYQMLGIKAITTSPYHPQTDGLVERLNQTLKFMLKKTSRSTRRQWDKMLPLILFAYREIPQETTGFSPFELLYSRDVKGPMDILKDQWIATQPEENDITSYVLSLRQRMEEAHEVAQQNWKKAQIKQKQWYDQHAREKSYIPGDQVLLLLPDSTQKFKAQWQGPYRIKKRIGSVNYELEIPERNMTKVFHCNLLKQWYPRTETSYTSIVGDSTELISPEWQEGEPRIGDQLTGKEKQELEKLLQQYKQVIDPKPGRAKRTVHKIVTDGSGPIRQRPYRIPPALKKDLCDELQTMLKDGLIEESSSEWSSPIVVVKKKDGSNRICVDYRKLNAITKFDAYPMPRIDEMLDAIGNAKYISTLDLAKGYWQIPMDQQDCEKTAFSSPLGLFQFTVMPFGLSGAPASFQRMMDQTLRGLNDFVGVYLDDIVIHSSTWKEHLVHLQQVLERLQDAGLTLKLKKCEFGAAECTYLGHRIGRGGVRPEQSKVMAIKQLKRPTTKKEVRAFLGMTGYYRRFIRDFAQIAEPLTNLTKKGLPESIEWSVAAETAFEKLKTTLTSSTVMRNPDPNLTFLVQTDASDVGIGVVLSQRDPLGNDYPITYFSKKLLDRERKYAVVEKECLAIKLGVQAFSVYLIGKPFIIQTDHRALQWLQKFKEGNSRLMRWSLTLQPYQFTVEHRKRQENANADGLSRLELEQPALRAKEGGRKCDKSELEDQMEDVYDQ